MALNSVLLNRFPAFYNHEMLTWRRLQLGLSVRQVSKAISGRETTVQQVFKGTVVNARQVFPVARYLGLDWAMVHDLALSESHYHLAVLAPLPDGRGGAYITTAAAAAP